MSNLVVQGKDPLNQGDNADRALFEALSKCANGFSGDAVLSASLNLLANVLRQTYGRRIEVETRIDEIMARLKQIVLDHYDPVTGRRRSTLPFPQVIRPQHFIDKRGL